MKNFFSGAGILISLVIIVIVIALSAISGKPTADSGLWILFALGFITYAASNLRKTSGAENRTNREVLRGLGRAALIGIPIGIGVCILMYLLLR